MSFYMATCYADRILLATDAAAYYSDGTVARLASKVHLVEGAPVAITARGEVKLTDEWIAAVSAAIAAGGLDAAVETLADALPIWRDRMGSAGEAEICIVGVGSTGPAIYHFRTVAEAGFVESFRLYESRSTVVGGIESADLHRHVMDCGRFDLFAIEIVNQLRRKHATTDSGGKDYACMGGQLDVTTVTSAGVYTETVHRWPADTVGNRIDPFAGTNVTPLVPAMNRQQRRAAEREAKRRA